MRRTGQMQFWETLASSKKPCPLWSHPTFTMKSQGHTTDWKAFSGTLFARRLIGNQDSSDSRADFLARLWVLHRYHNSWRGWRRPCWMIKISSLRCRKLWKGRPRRPWTSNRKEKLEHHRFVKDAYNRNEQSVSSSDQPPLDISDKLTSKKL